ncbi:MAG: glycosyltransferase family 4 protein [Gemmatimonadota bacterium]|nr:glycosyltransferase family 4 protein [Gemmatimonadota bacterium]
MRLIHLTSAGGWGGREMYPPILAAAQRNTTGHEVSLVAKRSTPLAGYLAETGLDYDILPVGPYLDPVAAWRLAHVLEKRRPEIIHVHLSRDLILVNLACTIARLNPAVILHKHIASAGNKRDIIHRYLYSRLSAVVAVSDYVRTSLIASCPLDPGKIKVVFCGLDTERFAHRLEGGKRNHRAAAMRAKLGAPDEHTVLAAVVGRLERRKGQEFFLQAAAVLAQKAPSLRFAVIGAPEGDYGRRLEQMAAELGIEKKVFFSGHMKDAAGIFAAVDILVVPSIEEAFGLVAAEGMSAGIPVVAFRSGALPEFISHGETGLLVPPGDTDALAGALESLSRDHEARLELGAAAREWVVSNLSMEKILRDIDRLYAECLGRHGG